MIPQESKLLSLLSNNDVTFFVSSNSYTIFSPTLVNFTEILLSFNFIPQCLGIFRFYVLSFISKNLNLYKNITSEPAHGIV